MASPFAGRRVVVSAGPTFEDIDPVRFVGNRSSGKMGFAIAAAAAALGARVRLVAGPVQLDTPDGVERIDVRSASRIGDRDFGDNADRIRSYLDEVANLAIALK